MPSQTAQNEAQRQHMLRFPECNSDDPKAITWHRRAKTYWELLGHRFNEKDQQRFCDMVAKIRFSNWDQTISQHSITREAVKDPNWPALILLQLGFKVFEKFKRLVVGRAISSAFPSATLTFPVPNGSPYDPLSFLTPGERQDIREKWDQVMGRKRHRAQKRMARKALISQAKSMPHLQHIQPVTITPGASDASFSPPPSFTSISDDEPSSQGSCSRSPAAQTISAPSLQSTAARSPPSPSETSRDSSVTKSDRGDDALQLSHDTMVIEDDSSSAESLADSDDLPIPQTLRSQSRREPKNSSKGTHRRALQELHPFSLSTNVGTTSTSCASEQVRSGSEESILLGNLSLDSGTAAHRTVIKDRRLAKQHVRSSKNGVEQPAHGKDLRRLMKKIKRLEQRLRNLEENRAGMEEKWRKDRKKQKQLLSTEQRGIEDLRRTLDCLSIELRVRAEHRLSRG
ncbi:hypothetical protein LIA77_05826 [Sarocladium implicatum]|nr:hypothetical protein LIA77_05826 [Sarocladium implicatum]